MPAVEESDYTVGELRLVLVVGHHHYCAVIILVQVVEEVHHLGAHLGVKVTGRLVGEYYLRISHNRAGYRHTLTLSARKLRRHVTHTVAESYTLKHLLGTTGAFARLHCAVQGRQLLILDYIERVDKMKTLEHESEFLISE